MNPEGGVPNLVIPTADGIPDDATVMELAEDPSQPNALTLLRWDGHELEVGSQIVHQGRRYNPSPISPPGCAPGGSTMQLFARRLDVFENFTDLPEHARNAVVAFLFTSWIPDLLLVPATLFLWALPVFRPASIGGKP
ncbi:MAG: hypothetical protein WBW53_00250 [Terriglobales bacterium]